VSKVRLPIVKGVEDKKETLDGFGLVEEEGQNLNIPDVELDEDKGKNE